MIAKRWVESDGILIDVWGDLPNRKQYMSELYNLTMLNIYGTTWRDMRTPMRQVEMFEAATEPPIARGRATPRPRRTGMTTSEDRVPSGERVLRIGAERLPAL